LGGENLSS